MSSNKRQPVKGVSQTTLDHFSNIPLVQSTLADQSFQVFSASRNVTHSGKGHTLSGKTWNTPETIKELLSFYSASTGEVRRFYTFGSDLNAHPDLLHGGVIATILDSGLGTVVELSRSKRTGPMFTAQLNTSYKKPVRTPGTIMVRAWVVRSEEEGRKVWAAGVVEGEGGVVHAKAEGLWLRAKSKM